MTRAPCEAEELRREIAKFHKINAKLISRVERSYDQSPNAYARRARRGGGGNAQ